jgi:transcriptional regulator with PAS, ATPase and Fis domain
MELDKNRSEQEWILAQFDSDRLNDGAVKQQSLPVEMQELEESRISEALEKCDHNRTNTALELGIGRTLLIHKIKKYNLFK